MNLPIDSLIKRLGLTPEKLVFWKKPPANNESEEPKSLTKSEPLTDTSSSVARALKGSTTLIEEFYFPPDVIGGMCPYVPGAAEETAWNAAAETCDSERVHIVWHSFDNRVWYLAIRSADLSSHSRSWCPFAALLPGMKAALPSPVCYTYYGEEIASMMTVTEEGLHIYRGTNPIVRAKAERTARELGNASIVDLVPERIATLEPVPWYSVSLFEERARRILAAGAVIVSLILTGLAFLVWLLASVALVSSRHTLEEAIARTQSKTLEVLKTAENLRGAPVREELARFADLNQGLLDLNGYLEVYATGKDGAIRWRATVPFGVTADRINALGGKTIDTKANGTVIGNAAEIAFEASGGKK